MTGGSETAAQSAAQHDPAGGIDVAIVAYRCRELLRECLKSLRANPPSAELRVIVVDNDSGDGTPEMVAAEYPVVELVEAGANIGFAAATNLAAQRGSAPFLLALNPDTQVTEGALDTMLATLEEHPEVAVVGPRLLRPDGSLDHASKRSFPTPLSALGHFTGLGRRPGASAGLAAYTRPRCRVRAGGRGQRSLHADAPLGVRAGGGIRRGLLDVHGGPRPLLPARARPAG